MSIQRLRDSRSVVLDSNGYGTIRYGPDRPNVNYLITSISVNVARTDGNPQVLEAGARVYHGNPSPATFISGTFTGSSGDTDDGRNETLWPGEYLTVEWTGGDAGATAYASFSGQSGDITSGF